MVHILKVIAGIINFVHNLIQSAAAMAGLRLTDKDLHFWVIGILGLSVWLVTDLLFKYISKWSLRIVSFIYAFTVMVVFVFAIEIEQKITGKGAMDMDDILASLWGFILFACAYIVMLALIKLIKTVIRRFRYR